MFGQIILMILTLLLNTQSNLNDIYKNIEEYKPNKKRKMSIVFDDMNADILNSKKHNPIVTALFIRGRKLNFLLFLLYNLILLCQKILDSI